MLGMLWYFDIRTRCSAASTGSAERWAANPCSNARMTSIDAFGLRLSGVTIGDFASTSNVHYATILMKGPIGQEVEDITKIHDPSWVPEDEPFHDNRNSHSLK